MAPGLRTTSGTPPSSRKRHLSDCAKPTTPPPLDLSSPKKTRDLPNLTECQACGSRTDTANGKNRIQTLYSEWRIVLLCSRCYHRVDSSEICSYCFKEASEDYFSCGQCKRSLHKTCFLNCKSVPPWSFSICGSEFTVCIDCWVPKQIARKRGNFRRNKKAKNSSILDNRDGGGAKLLESVVKDANYAMGKKVEAAVKAREMAVKKAIVAKRAVELASNALEECDDAELAFRLHRAMNSSPRISKNRILGDQNGLEFLIAGNRVFSGLKPTEIVYARRSQKPTQIVYAWCGNEPTEMVYVRRRKKPTKLVYKRRRKHSECKEDCGVEIRMKEREESCSSLLLNSSGFHSSMKSESKPCNYQDDCTVFKDTRSDVKLVHYLLTYSRKKSNSKETPNGKIKFLCEEYNLESQATGPRLPESLMISTSTLQHCDIPHQAAAGASDS
ncbi:PREDICTED: uncharacterized protein LOC18608347 [Theobroma cacao]|uniref:Uncharacterized protein LOC18608347 n=1 Tax=Theobroma cacao TaxID=3641 RepID=A0AB32VW70_THECC|nr:PREDICTED: uncharacterized protein LOC18608347 [Theobroma cacao]